MSYKKSPFENAPKKHSNKTRFNLSHEHKDQLMPGYIIPCMRPIETLPGDEFTINSEYFFRFESLYFPIMHKLTMRADTYFIPNRILWPEGTSTNVGWKNWISKQEDITPPHFTARMAFNTLAWNFNVLSHFGLPLLPPSGTAGFETSIPDLNALPLSALLMIWDWYERIPQLEDEIWFPLTDGDNTAAFDTAYGVAPGTIYPLLSAKWEKDYFTSATPTPQIGDPVKIPQVIPFDQMLLPSFVDNAIFRKQSDGTAATAGDVLTDVGGIPSIGGVEQVYYDPMDTAATIRQLREAEVLQSFYERIMKIGDRYDDFIEGMFGTQPQPGHIQIPILLGSTFGKVQISDVMTTADQVSTSLRRTGDYAGQANLYEPGNNTMRYTCHEHGFILQVIQINANTSYGQGIDRLWRRSVQTDYALDMFASIGDQEILKEEVLYNAKTTELSKNQETFGYIDRFAEYKWLNNLHVHNLNFNVGLSQHLGRIYDQVTTVGAVYDDAIEINGHFTNSASFDSMAAANIANLGGHRLVDVFRVLPAGSGSVQYPTQGTIFSWIFHSIWVNRQLPLYSTPKL